MPDELRQQMERIRQVVATLSIPILELEGYEADDVLGTIARQAKDHDVPVHIITGDRGPVAVGGWEYDRRIASWPRAARAFSLQ